MAREPDEIFIDGRRLLREYDDDGNVKRIRVLPPGPPAPRAEPPPSPPSPVPLPVPDPVSREPAAAKGVSVADRMRALRSSAAVDRAKKVLARPEKKSEPASASSPAKPVVEKRPPIVERMRELVPKLEAKRDEGAAPSSSPTKPRGFEIVSAENVVPRPLPPAPKPAPKAEVVPPSAPKPKAVPAPPAAPPSPPPPRKAYVVPEHVLAAVEKDVDAKLERARARRTAPPPPPPTFARVSDEPIHARIDAKLARASERAGAPRASPVLPPAFAAVADEVWQKRLDSKLARRRG